MRAIPLWSLQAMVCRIVCISFFLRFVSLGGSKEKPVSSILSAEILQKSTKEMDAGKKMIKVELWPWAFQRVTSSLPARTNTNQTSKVVFLLKINLDKGSKASDAIILASCGHLSKMQQPIYVLFQPQSTEGTHKAV